MTAVVDRDALNNMLLAAHAKDDALGLMNAYDAAASALEQGGDINAAAFFRTHALVFALEAGAKQATQLEDWLRSHDRM